MTDLAFTQRRCFLRKVFQTARLRLAFRGDHSKEKKIKNMKVISRI